MTQTATEADVERLLRDWLELHGWIVLKTDAGEVARATRQRGRRSALPAGTPDLIALKNGRGIAIECKSPGRQTSRRQRLEHARYEHAGVPIRVIKSLEGLQAWLEELGLYTPRPGCQVRR